jgi:hypothetical protein
MEVPSGQLMGVEGERDSGGLGGGDCQVGRWGHGASGRTFDMSGPTQ